MTVRIILASLALLSAPYWALYAKAAAGGPLPSWAEAIDGFLYAEHAISEIRASEEDGKAVLAVDEATVAKAKLAYSMEPLATDALFVAALDTDEARSAILAAARANDKRNRLVGLSLLELAATSNETETVLLLVDELTRVQPELAGQFVSVLIASLNDDQSLPLLEQALAANPEWAASFWRRVPKEGAALRRFVQLRERISPPADVEAEQSLVQLLVQHGRFADAFDVYSEASRQGEHEASFPPLDWHLSQTRDLRARQTSADSFELFIQRDTSGKIAEKLIRLKAGVIVLSGQLEGRQGQAKLEVELRCANPGSGRDWPVRTSLSNARWTIPDASCRYAWLTLSGSAWDSSLAFDGTLRDLKYTQHSSE